METKVHIATEKIHGQSILQPEGFFLQDNDRPLISEHEGFSSRCIDCLASNNIEFELHNPGNQLSEVQLTTGSRGIKKELVSQVFGPAVKRMVERMTKSANLPVSAGNSNLAPNLSDLKMIMAGTEYSCPVDFLKSRENEVMNHMLAGYVQPKKGRLQKTLWNFGLEFWFVFPM